MTQEVKNILNSFQISDLNLSEAEIQNKRSEILALSDNLDKELRQKQPFLKSVDRAVKVFDLSLLLKSCGTVLAYCKAVERTLRKDDLGANKANNSQVARHSSCDLWGLVLSFEVSYLNFIDAACESGTRQLAIDELSAAAESLLRIACNCSDEISLSLKRRAKLATLRLIDQLSSTLPSVGETKPNGSGTLGGAIVRHLDVNY